MSKNQTYDKCQYFGIRNLCPHREHELMKQFVADTEVPQSNVPINLDFSKEGEINKLCSSCDKFKAH